MDRSTYSKPQWYYEGKPFLIMVAGVFCFFSSESVVHFAGALLIVAGLFIAKVRLSHRRKELEKVNRRLEKLKHHYESKERST
mgnify:CR=1 FL=1